MWIRGFGGKSVFPQGVAGATNKELRIGAGSETVSARDDREPNVRWTFGERQKGEIPMEVFPKGISSSSTAKNLGGYVQIEFVPTMSFVGTVSTVQKRKAKLPL
jgi:hypothetical protein